MILANKKIIITRAVHQAAPFVRRLESLGAAAICFPTIEISQPDSWFDVDEKLKRLNEYDWIVFTSVNSVTYLTHRLRFLKLELPELSMAAIGSETQKKLRECGYNADVLPEVFTASSLLKSFEQYDLKKKRVLLPVSDMARHELHDGLSQRGAAVDRVVVYQNGLADPENKHQVIEDIQQNKIDLLTFFSPSAFVNFAKIVGPPALETVRRHNIAIAVIGPTTAAAVRQSGLTPHIEPRTSTSDDVLRAIVNYYQKKD